MNLDRRTFTSKVARRAFIVFVGCALLPVSILAIISVRQVTAELRAQSERRLRQTSKAVGLILHKRLLDLDAAIETNAASTPETSTEEKQPPFLGVARVAPDGKSTAVSGHIETLPSLSAEQLHHVASGQSLLAVEAGDTAPARIFLIRSVDSRQPDKGTLIGEINPAYLWITQDEETLEAGTKLAVLDDAGRTLISSFGARHSLAKPVMFAQNAAAGQFTWNDGTREQVGSYWSLFLRNKFLLERMIIVLNRPTADILAPVADFNRTFVVVCVLSLLFVLFLSVGQIRKILEPLGLLQAFTSRLALGHLDTRVEIKSRDEFADLGKSFNQMAGQLERQFDALAMRSEITVALSRSERTEEVLRQCMEILVRHLDLTVVGLWLSETDGAGLGRRAIAGLKRCTDGAPQQIQPGAGEIGRVAADARPYTTDDLATAPGHADVAWLGQEPRIAFVGHPLVIDGRLQGVAAVYATRPLDGTDLGSIASAVGEIAQGIERRRAADSLRSSEEQVRQLQKMEAVGRLTGGIAHDFNNLLTVMMCSSHVMASGLSPDDPKHRMAIITRDTAQRASRLTQQLLTFSRKQALATVLLDLNAVVTEATTLLQRMIGETISLTVVTGKDLGLIKLDRSQIEQVIVNLVVNARDAMPAGGQITIETASTLTNGTRQVMLKVTDTGTGMDAATQAKIFEPFFTTKAPGKGTGLGLATVQGIIAQSGGSIRVESKLGVGTSFILCFPLATGEAERVVATAAPPARGDETVLLVEDEYEVGILLQKILEDHGYTVMNARRPSEALRLSEDHKGPIHLLVTDMVMPEMSGAVLSKRLGATRPEMAVLKISGYADYHGEDVAGAMGTAAFLQKPFPPETFARKVRELLDSASARASIRRAA